MVLLQHPAVVGVPVVAAAELQVPEVLLQIIPDQLNRDIQEVVEIVMLLHLVVAVEVAQVVAVEQQMVLLVVTEEMELLHQSLVHL
jgi:hypothetical protein